MTVPLNNKSEGRGQAQLMLDTIEGCWSGAEPDQQKTDLEGPVSANSNAQFSQGLAMTSCCG